MTREYFECLGSGSDREILECLKKQWSERGWNELIPLIAEFESLVERYSKRKTREKRRGSIYLYDALKGSWLLTKNESKGS